VSGIKNDLVKENIMAKYKKRGKEGTKIVVCG